VARCRERSWKDWVTDLDVEKFFDSVRWDLIVTAVQARTDLPWVAALYVRRWRAALLQLPGGSLLERDRGTPQGSPVPPYLRTCSCTTHSIPGSPGSTPGIWSERYADDAVVHRATRGPGRADPGRDRRAHRAGGFAAAPGQDPDRVLQGPRPARLARAHVVHVLGLTFRALAARGKNGKKFTSFLPAVSKDTLAKMTAQVPRLAAVPAHLARHGRPRPADQSVVLRWMRYYRAFLPLRAAARQRLPDALDPQEVQAAGTREEGQGLLERFTAEHSRLFRPLGTGSPRPVGQDDRSRVTGTLSSTDLRRPRAEMPQAPTLARSRACRPGLHELVEALAAPASLADEVRDGPREARVNAGLAVAGPPQSPLLVKFPFQYGPDFLG
jgi:hypothetical protein